MNRNDDVTQDGSALIGAERQRQITVECWTPSHDDQDHYEAELMRAAMAYLKVTHHPERYTATAPDNWPWDQSWWKPSDDPIRNLVKAGALIAAEIDRLQRSNDLHSTGERAARSGV